MGNKQIKNENKHFNNNINIESMNNFKKDEDLENFDNKDKDKYKFNILFIGESGIGTKTSLIKRIKKGIFIQLKKPEEKCEYLFFEKENKKIILYLIDTNGKKERRNNSNDYHE